MKDRIRLIMEAEDMTPARFADTLQIGRPVISHILNGRNNPSLDVITRILSEMPYINADWLISGKGTMYKDGYVKTSTSPVFSEEQEILVNNNREPDLFSQSFTNPENTTEKAKYETEKELSSPIEPIDIPVKEVVKYINKPDKKISKIIIYYSDNTYEAFSPEK